MKRLFIPLFSLLSASIFSEPMDPMTGKRHLILDAEYIYVHRAPKIHNKNQLAVSSYTEIPGIVNPNPPTKCSNISLKPTQILKNQGWTSGLRLTANYLLNKQVNWQARYVGLLKWNGEKCVSCHGTLRFPFKNGENPTYDYLNADTMKGSCRTSYYSYEANYWYIVTPRRVDYFSVSWVFGMKYMNLKEHFDLNSMVRVCSDSESSDYKITTKNRIIGPQIGGDLEGNFGLNFTWGVSAKLGPVLDFAQNITKFLDKNNTKVIKKYNPSDFNLCFLGEIAPFVLFNLTDKILFKASYELNYLSNVALAMNQISFRENETTDLRNNVDIGGYFMFYGAYIGLGFDF